MATVDPKRAKITDEHRAEAARLRALWKAARDLPSQAEFGKIYKIGEQAAVSSFLNGRSALSQKAALGFASGLGCAISDFSPRLAAEIASLTSLSGAIATSAHLIGALTGARADAERDLSDALDGWAVHASPRSREVIDQLRLMAQKNVLGDEDWDMIKQLAERFQQKRK